MKLQLIALTTAILLPGCAVTPTQQQTAIKDVGVALDILQVATNTAVTIVVADAVGSSDLSNKANLLDSAAAGLRSLETSTDGVLSPSVVGVVVQQFTGSAAHWDRYAAALVDIFTKINNPSTNQKLETLATSANIAAKAARTAAAIAP